MTATLSEIRQSLKAVESVRSVYDSLWDALQQAQSDLSHLPQNGVGVAAALRMVAAGLEATTDAYEELLNDDSTQYKLLELMKGKGA
jgi:hypothetical protein